MACVVHAKKHKVLFIATESTKTDSTKSELLKNLKIDKN